MFLDSAGWQVGGWDNGVVVNIESAIGHVPPILCDTTRRSHGHYGELIIPVMFAHGTLRTDIGDRSPGHGVAQHWDRSPLQVERPDSTVCVWIACGDNDPQALL